jgi:NAD(P)-dependent dehydrogenase (short-subunit alcohol dehydrogenase family)
MNEPVAMITGAGRGIGRATAEAFAARGCRLILIARTESQLHEIAAPLKVPCELIPADVTDKQQIDAAIASAPRRFGRVDYFIHSAGVAPRSSVESMTDAQWDSIIATNLTAFFRFSRGLWPTFKNQGGGAIVNISSISAKDPFDGLGPYGASKAAANLLCQAMAREGAADNIRVHTVAPGATETAMFRSLFSPEQFPTEKALLPVEVANVVVQCAMGDLRYSSGEVIYIRKSLD